MGSRAQSRGGLTRRRLHVLVLLLPAAGVVAGIGAGRGRGAGDEPEEPTALATRLLAAIYTQPMEALQVEALGGRAQREGECRVVARWVDDQGARSRASLTIDVNREEIRTYVGPLLTDLPDPSSDGRLRTAEEFARAHRGPFTDAT